MPDLLERVAALALDRERIGKTISQVESGQRGAINATQVGKNCG